MTNEISINWNKNQSSVEPIFEAFDESELEELNHEAMALYGEACYIEDSIRDYVMEAADDSFDDISNTKHKSNELKPMYKRIAIVIKRLITNFINTVTRFIRSKTNKKAFDYFSKGFLSLTLKVSKYNNATPEFREHASNLCVLLTMFGELYMHSIQYRKLLKNLKLRKDFTLEFERSDIEVAKKPEYFATAVRKYGPYWSFANMREILNTLKEIEKGVLPAIESFANNPNYEQFRDEIINDSKNFAKFQVGFNKEYKYFLYDSASKQFAFDKNSGPDDFNNQLFV